MNTLRAGRVLEERLRTRIIQGAGRRTRGLKDHSVVIVLGSGLTSFLQRREVREALRPEIQAEVAFGIENSQVTEKQLKEMIDSCLIQDDDWQNDAEANIAELRHDLERQLPPGTESLASSAKSEVRAWNLVLTNNFSEASQMAMEIAQSLGDNNLTPYRAFWFYLSGEWLRIEATQTNDEGLRQASNNLLSKARTVARGTTWLRELIPELSEDSIPEPIDELLLLQSLNTRFVVRRLRNGFGLRKICLKDSNNQRPVSLSQLSPLSDLFWVLKHPSRMAKGERTLFGCLILSCGSLLKRKVTKLLVALLVWIPFVKQTVI